MTSLRIHRRLCLWLTLLLSLLSHGAMAQGVTLPEVTRVELDNGAVLILSERHDVPMIGVTAMLAGGAVADPTDKQGLSSLFGALLEKGAGERSAAGFAEAIAAAGGNLAVATERERISISGDFMAQDADLMIELIADMLIRPTLDRGEFEKLRERSINVIRAARDSDPRQLMASYFSAFLFGDHPYGHAISGSELSLENISHRDMRDYHETQLGADRLVISLSGEFDVPAMIEKLSVAFSGWRPAAADAPVVTAPAKEAGSRVLLVDKPGATQTYFWIGSLGVARGYPNRADLNIANTVFGGRYTSMLNNALRVESGLTYGARAYLERLSQPGYVAISSYTQTETSIEAIDMALGVLGQLRDTGIDAPMVDSARNYIMGQFPPTLETGPQIASVFADLETSGLDASYIDDYAASLALVTSKTVAAVIDEVYPREDELVYVFIGDAELIREAINKYGPVTEMSITEPRFSAVSD